MEVLTQYHISELYKNYSLIDVTFNKNVIKSTNIIKNKVYLKSGDKNYPCIIYSLSMVSAKIVITADRFFFKQIEKNNSIVSLHFAFKRLDKSIPLTLFINSKIVEYKIFSPKRPDYYFVTLKYIQKPSNDLIGILGTLIQNGIDSKNRSDQRILINDENIKKLNILSRYSSFIYQGKEIKCIIHDLSLSGVKIITIGKGDKYIDKHIILKIEFSEQPEICKINGKIIRYYESKGEYKFIELGILFDKDNIPESYKTRLIKYINTYL